MHSWGKLTTFVALFSFLKMANEQRLISGIEYKVRKLIELNNELRNENAELHQKIDALNRNVVALTNELEVKRNELLKISLAQTIESELGVEEGKERLDNLIEEIDRCIEVMSD